MFDIGCCCVKRKKEEKQEQQERATAALRERCPGKRDIALRLLEESLEEEEFSNKRKKIGSAQYTLPEKL